MISRVLQSLADRQLVENPRTCRYVVVFTKAASTCLLIFKGKAPHLFVKYSTQTHILDDAQRYFSAQTAAPFFVPHQHAAYMSGDLAIVVTDALDYRWITLDEVRTRAKGGSPRASLVQFFSAGRNQVVPPLVGDVFNREVVQALRTHLIENGHLDLAEQAFPASTRDWIASLPDVAQHGDFSITNIAVIGPRAVAFDWEDFGKIRIPGLDVFQFFLSFGLDVRAMAKDWSGVDASLRNFVADCMGAMQLSEQDFQRLLAIYPIAIWYLRRTYSAEIQSKMERIATDIVAR